MTGLFTLKAEWPDPVGDENKLFIGIDAQRFGLLPQKSGIIVLSRECSSIAELKASIEELKRELDGLVHQGEQHFK